MEKHFSAGTKEFYKKHGYTWQTNVDELFEFTWTVTFGSVLDKLAGIKENDALLDIGCGVGQLLDYSPKGKYIGIDISEENILRARELHPREEFLEMDATKMDFPDDTFQYIVCVETIEHLTIDELHDLLEEIKRVGKKGAKIIITTPNLYYLWRTIPWRLFPIKRRMTFRKLFQGIRKGYVNEDYNLPVHHYCFRPSFLRALFEGYFTVKSIGSNYWYNNRAIHGLWPNFQMRILKFSAMHTLLGLKLGMQLIIELVNDKKNS
ncbi:MAG: methyltransferase domain-containing protein [Candidatus Brennerbacteria bacterium]